MSAEYKRAVFVLLAVLLAAWTLFIFSNSIKSKAESAKTSSKVAQIVKPVVDPKNKMSDNEFHNVVRKLAHGFEFMVHGALACATALAAYNGRRKWLFMAFPPLFSTVCAAADEYIQTHTGRGAAFTDVLIDMGGAAVGIALFALVFMLCRKFNVNRV